MARLWLLRFSVICAAIPVLLSLREADRTGQMKGLTGAIRVCVMALVTSPRWPWRAPPRVLGTEAALALTCL